MDLKTCIVLQLIALVVLITERIICAIIHRRERWADKCLIAEARDAVIDAVPVWRSCADDPPDSDRNVIILFDTFSRECYHICYNMEGVWHAFSGSHLAIEKYGSAVWTDAPQPPAKETK